MELQNSFFAQYSSHFQEILNTLTEYLAPPSKQERGVVFLLGAGCSMQYGLPSFQDLLSRIYNDRYRQSGEEEKREQDALRKALNKVWRGKDAIARRAALRPYLSHVNGKDCPGYRRLARLMREGLVCATINMNFDTLLEEACEYANFPSPPIRKIHGSLRPEGGTPVITIEETEFFRKGTDFESTRDLLLKNHVVAMGYSGSDTWMTNSLRPESTETDPPKLFFVAVGPPAAQMRPAIIERESESLTISGPEGGFENFMEALEATLYQFSSTKKLPEPIDRPSPSKSYLTAQELKGLSECLNTALQIRATMNVADARQIGIEQHGDELFDLCLTLASKAGISLTPPERYLIYCAAYFHDLGYFRAYSGGRTTDHSGWRLLNEHGNLTAQLLEKYLLGDRRQQLTPASYDTASVDKFTAMLIALCRTHTRHFLASNLLPEKLNFNLDSDSISILNPQDEPYHVSVRFRLLHALFSTAEEISEGHPFLPSADPVETPTSETSADRQWRTIEDPVLDIYLRRKGKNNVRFTITREVIHAKILESSNLRAVDFLLTLAQHCIEHLDRTVRENGGTGIRLEVERALPRGKSEEDLLGLALEWALAENLDQVSSTKDPAQKRYILDLMALYALDNGAGNAGEPPEPKVGFRSKTAKKGIEKIVKANDLPHEGLIHVYLRQRASRQHKSNLERRFCRDFEMIYLPAWRFCAHNWRRGIDAVVMACTSLDLGSTPLRSEVTYGLRHLWNEKIVPNMDDTYARGHNGCTLCTGRLLYILSHARLFFRPQDLVLGNESGGIGRAIMRLAAYMTAEGKRNEVWWGIEDEVMRGEHGIQSADYAAWAVRSLAFCLWVESRLSKSQPPLFSAEMSIRLRSLFKERLRDVCEAPGRKLLSPRSEEPHSYILGDVARTYLIVQRLRSLPDGDLLDDRLIACAAENLAEAYAVLTRGDLSQISQFYLLPAIVFLHSKAADPDKRQELGSALVQAYTGCAGSSIWIKDGEDAGSWGYNTENTARLVLSLSAFWRYAFENKDEFEMLLGKSAPIP